MKKVLIIILTISVILLFPFASIAQEEASPQKEKKYKAKIAELLLESCPEGYSIEENTQNTECYFFKLEILEGERKGEIVESTISLEDDIKLQYLNYKKGQIVYIVETEIAGEIGYYVKEPVRKGSLITITIIFMIVVIAIGGIQGVSSLLGLTVSFGILRFIVIPSMLSGTNPILASIIGGTLILISSVYLSHGFNKKTTLAILGTSLSLILTAILASIYTTAVRLTGYSTDEATFLIQLVDTPIDMRGILLASLIIGGIGILDDITVSQVSVIAELLKANPIIDWKELFKRSMNVGKDHIASMVNTLILAYTSSALPLVMLFIASGSTFEEIINYELIAEEIVRTLVASIGLILAVPITSLIASISLTRSNTQQPFRRFR